MNGSESPVRRIITLVTAAFVAVSGIGVLAGPAGAQTETGDVAAFSAARLEGNDAQGKAENLAIMNRALAAAPASVLPQITALRDAYQKKGDKLFNGAKGLRLIAALDSWVYDNCPGTQVAATAIDYGYEGVPATLAAGPTNFKMTNAAPKEDHMMAIAKLTPAAEGEDVSKILNLPEKKQNKYIEQTGGAFLFAQAGEVAYSPANLEPGTYVYACFLPVGGKRNGAPHFTQGMYGSFDVS